MRLFLEKMHCINMVYTGYTRSPDISDPVRSIIIDLDLRSQVNTLHTISHDIP